MDQAASHRDDQPSQPTVLDRLAEAGWNPMQVAGTRREQQGARTIARLLGLLDTNLDAEVSAGRDVRIESTVARVAAMRTAGADSVAVVGAHDDALCLSDTDARDIDRLVGAGWNTGSPSAAAKLLALLDAGASVESAARTSLVDRTLDLVQADIEREHNRFRIRPSDDRMSMPRRLRMSDLGALAAMFLIGVGILWPVVTGMRAENQRVASAANMQAAGLGFGLFANDHDDKLPSYEKRDPSGVWWKVGDAPRSHSANLFTLVRRGYASVEELASPGNPNAPIRAWDENAQDWRAWNEVSYSYQLFGTEVPRLASHAGTTKLVMTDRSPVIDQARQGRPIDPLRGSPNTNGWGQHLLFADGQVVFSRSPVLSNGDNIWLPRGIESQAARITGTELPADRTDAFVGP